MLKYVARFVMKVVGEIQEWTTRSLRPKYTLVYGEGGTRIQCLRNFTLVDGTEIKKGDLGGFVDGEHNITHRGTCWIMYPARVCDHAQVRGDAIVFGETEIRGHARIG